MAAVCRATMFIRGLALLKEPMKLLGLQNESQKINVYSEVVSTGVISNVSMCVERFTNTCNTCSNFSVQHF